jgi:hypothetical protein
MGERLRVTGDWPPRAYWERYPNWENAYDEEGEEGQDETTLRPSPVQDYIHEDTTFTVGQVKSADGQTLEALLTVPSGELEEANAFADDHGVWTIFYSSVKRKWLVCDYKQMPKIVELDEPRIFPLTIKSRLPRQRRGKPFHVVINADGSSAEIAQ